MIHHASAIRYFEAVRRAGSIREAARRLNIASSAVNRQILKLEQELGAPLFERMPAGIRLTAAGEIFARHVSTVLHDARRAEEEMAALKDLRRGHVRLASVEGLSADLLPSVITRQRAEFPLISVSVITAGSRSVAAAVMEGDADIGVAFHLPRLADLRQVAVGLFGLGAVMTPDHMLASRPTLTLQACADFPWYLASDPLSIREHLEPALRRLNRPVLVVVEANFIELMKQLALHDHGICFQTRLGLEPEIASGRLVHVPLADPGLGLSELGVYIRTGRGVSTAEAMMLEILTEEIGIRAKMERRP
jgi:DNA-binding transcriptional LysR family regulator